MPNTNSFPFRRLFCDHMFAGTSRVWWELERTFHEPGPHTFQLEVGHTNSPNATDWVPVGSPIVDATYAEDTEQRIYGKTLLSHYRVRLTTRYHEYVSNPVGISGLLAEHDWNFAREIARKENLRLGTVGRPGTLLKRIRYGAPCTRCLDKLTDQVTDSKCPLCHGVGKLVGYHAPIPLQCWDLDGEKIAEKRNGASPPGQNRPTIIRARVLGYPQLSAEDVWVDDASDQRWFVDEIEQIASWKGVPIVNNVTMRLAPYTDAVYCVGVNEDSRDTTAEELPTAGTGCVTVDHNYGGNDNLVYVTRDGCGVLGGTISAFTKSQYDDGVRDPAYAVAATTTLADGRWSYALKLDPGEYVLVAEKVGDYAPTAFPLTVTGAPPPLMAGKPQNKRIAEAMDPAFRAAFGSV